MAIRATEVSGLGFLQALGLQARATDNSGDFVPVDSPLPMTPAPAPAPAPIVSPPPPPPQTSPAPMPSSGGTTTSGGSGNSTTTTVTEPTGSSTTTTSGTTTTTPPDTSPRGGYIDPLGPPAGSSTTEPTITVGTTPMNNPPPSPTPYTPPSASPAPVPATVAAGSSGPSYLPNVNNGDIVPVVVRDANTGQTRVELQLHPSQRIENDNGTAYTIHVAPHTLPHDEDQSSLMPKMLLGAGAAIGLLVLTKKFWR